VHVFFSIPFADDATSRAVEPQAPLVSRRFEALRRVASAGIPTGVSIAPIIPGLNDDDIPAILERARDAGAMHASHVLLRLPGNVREVFLERIRTALPGKARKVENRIRDVRGGALNESRFFERQKGHGAFWDLIESQWQVHARRLGFEGRRVGEKDRVRDTFRRPGAVQGSLFE